MVVLGGGGGPLTLGTLGNAELIWSGRENKGCHWRANWAHTCKTVRTSRFLTLVFLGGGTQDKMSKGHLPRVVYHQVYIILRLKASETVKSVAK